MQRIDLRPSFHVRAILCATLVCGSLMIGSHAIQDASAAPGDRLVAVYQARPAGDQGVTPDALLALQLTLQRRLNAYGMSDFLVQTQGADQITVEVPNTADAQLTLKMIGQVGLCEFVASDRQFDVGSTITTSLGGPESVGLNPDGTQAVAVTPVPTGTSGPVYQTILQSTDIADAVVQSNRNPGSLYPGILLTLNAAAAQTFGDYTEAHIGSYMSVIVDERVRISAIIWSRIGGMAVLDGPRPEDLQAIAAFLRSGPLIVPLVLIDTHTV